MGGGPDGKQVRFLQAAMDLMGYNGMPMGKSDERNVAISKEMERCGFPGGIWPAGIASKAESKVSGITVGGSGWYSGDMQPGVVQLL